MPKSKLSNNKNNIYVLSAGYSYVDAENSSYLRANCSCVLIRTINGRNIIVDTMTAWDGERLVEILKSYDLEPSDIDAVVCTHGHSDHIGCNYLFKNAEWHFVGTCPSNRDKYYADWTEESPPFPLDGDEVVVERTPGHTKSCVSVIVRNTQIEKTVGICGDLFECVEDIDDEKIWLDAGSEYPNEQRKQRLRMAEMCNFIIPGHGNGFHVTHYILTKLRLNLEQNKNDAIKKELMW